MKKLIILSLAALPFLASCRKELNEDPFNSIPDSEAFSNPDRIDKASTGMYDALQNSEYFGGRILIYADIRGIDATPATYFGQMALFNTVTANDGTVALAWRGAYRTIYEANLFLRNFAPHTDLVTPAKADQYVGEAKFIRSLVYFYLVNMWAQPYSFTADASHPGVPLVLQAVDPSKVFSDENKIPRSTVKQVYDAMEADLLEAETKLPDPPSDKYARVSRANKDAARALLMRLYLYKKDWTKANTYANKLIGKYALNPSPVTTFRDYTTNESIFSVAMDGGDNPNTNNALGQHYGVGRRADIPISATYINLLEATDKRKASNGSDSLVEAKSGGFWTRKYNAGITDWVPVFRYAEVLLVSAEALANQAAGTTADPTAITRLNEVKTRSSATPVTPATKAALLNEIYLERRRELAFEGQGSLDFLRTGRDIPAHGAVGVQAFGSDYTVLPIPRYDTDKNENLAQNKGY
jgi:hypothetical protein